MVGTIAIVDYGMGNLHSAAKAVARAVDNAKVIVTSQPAEIAKADKIVFPGVGAMRDCMLGLRQLDLIETVSEVSQQKPFLAICVGMQALMDSSEENNGVNCLGLIKGKVRYFGDELLDENQARLKIPHMGWNQVKQQVSHPLWKDIPDNSRFYFVHSYYTEVEDASVIAGMTCYGLDFTSVIAKNNIFAVQFHPEKSHNVGLTLLTNFAKWNGEV